MKPSKLARNTFRRKSNLLLAAMSEIGSPLLTFGARLTNGELSSPPSGWRNGILVGAAHIGDVLYTTPSLKFLKAGLPNCAWHFLAPPAVSEVLANNPYLASRPTATLRDAVEEIEPDVVICYNSGAYWGEILKAAYLGIPNRVGYVHKGFSALVTFPIRIKYPQPYPAYFRDLVGQIVDITVPDGPLRPQLFPTDKNEERADIVWRGLNLPGSARIVACFLTSRQRSGVPPPEKFGEIVSCLERNSAAQTILLGAKEDEGLLEWIKAKHRLRSHVLAGKLDLASLACFLRRCSGVLCPDSGPRHIANAVGTPVVFFRNVAVNRIETGKYCDSEIDAAPNDQYLSGREQAAFFEKLNATLVAKQVISAIGS